MKLIYILSNLLNLIILLINKMETNWNQHFANFIKQFNDKPWDWYGLSSNPNITMDIV